MENVNGRVRKRWSGEEDNALVAGWGVSEYLDDLALIGLSRDIASLASRAAFLRRNGVALKKLRRKPAYRPDFAALSSRVGAGGHPIVAVLQPAAAKGKK